MQAIATLRIKLFILFVCSGLAAMASMPVMADGPATYPATYDLGNPTTYPCSGSFPDLSDAETSCTDAVDNWVNSAGGITFVHMLGTWSGIPDALAGNALFGTRVDAV